MTSPKSRPRIRVKSQEETWWTASMLLCIHKGLEHGRYLSPAIQLLCTQEIIAMYGIPARLGRPLISFVASSHLEERKNFDLWLDHLRREIFVMGFLRKSIPWWTFSFISFELIPLSPLPQILDTLKKLEGSVSERRTWEWNHTR